MASVTFKRGTRAEIEATAKQDGQILMETDQNKKNKMYIDLSDGRRVLIGNSGEAIDTFYDNTTSGLDATNVQNAIDTLNSNLARFVKSVDITKSTSTNGNIRFDDVIDVKKNLVISAYVKEGESNTHIGIVYSYTTKNGMFPSGIHVVTEGSMTVVANKQVSVRLFYVPIN